MDYFINRINYVDLRNKIVSLFKDEFLLKKLSENTLDEGYCPKSCVNSLAIKLLWLILLITSEFNKKEGG